MYVHGSTRSGTSGNRRTVEFKSLILPSYAADSRYRRAEQNASDGPCVDVLHTIEVTTRHPN
jgi:hypothetical protein